MDKDLRFILKDSNSEDAKLLAEGRIGLAEHLPWVSDRQKAKHLDSKVETMGFVEVELAPVFRSFQRQATEAMDTYSDGALEGIAGGEGGGNNGMPVSDADDDEGVERWMGRWVANG
eukprot:Skav210472  [mRNA]  locus=scaffold737:480357:483762:- [translate_table: standard]